MLQIDDQETRRVRLIARDTDEVFEAEVHRDGSTYTARAVRGISPRASVWGSSIEQAVEGLDFEDSDGKTVDANRISHYEFA